MHQRELHRILHYEPETGIFTWAEKTSRKVVVGAVAGCATKAGYIVIGINGKLYYAHQLAWLYQTGEWLPRIDHKDGDGTNNAWDNLRPATAKQNALNSKRAANNSSGFKGVSWHKAAGKWAAHICAGGKKTHLGLYEGAEEAHAAYVLAARTVDPNFARAA